MAGVGATLASLGAGQQQEAGQVLANAADQETERNRQNKALEQQEKAGKVQLGSTLGAVGVGLAGAYATSTATAAALAGGASASAAAAAGASAGSFGGPLGMLIGGAVGAIAAGLFV